MSKHLTRLFDPHADTGPGRDGAPLLPDATIQPREASPAVPQLRMPTSTTRQQLIEQHGEGLGSVAWEAEVKFRADLAAHMNTLQQRLAGLNNEIATILVAGQPRLRKLQAAVDAAQTAFYAATADYETGRVALESSVGPLRGQVEGLLRELHQPLHAGRTKNWQSVPDSTSVLPREH